MRAVKVRVGFGFGVRTTLNDHGFGDVVDALEGLGFDSLWLSERISGEAPDDWFVGPAWCLDKPVIRREFLARLESRDTWQGKQFNGSTIGPA